MNIKNTKDRLKFLFYWLLIVQFLLSSFCFSTNEINNRNDSLSPPIIFNKDKNFLNTYENSFIKVLKGIGFSDEEALSATTSLSLIFPLEIFEDRGFLTLPNNIELNKILAVNINETESVILKKENDYFVTYLTTTKLANELIFNSNKVIDLRKDIIKINDIKLDYNKVINFSNITINKGDNLNKILSSFIYDKKKLKSIINSFKKFKDPSKIKSGTVLQVIKNNKNILGFYIPINSEEYLITYAKEGIYKSEIIKIIKAKSFLKKNIYIEYRNKNNLITRIDLFNNSSYDVYEKTLAKGQSIYQLLKNLDVNNKDINNILTKIKPFYDLRQILVGDKLDIIFNSDNNLQGISLEIDRVTKLQVTKINNIYRVFYYKKPFKVKNIYKEVVINTNFYNDAQKFKLPKNVFYDLVKLLSFSLDFQRDIKKNTSFLVLYENLYDFENNLITTGKILYSKVLFKKKNLEMFYFNRIEGNGKYFDSNGKSIRKTLMKTPIDGARLSSGFGKRRHPILGFNKMHKGIDFAAKKGTPIYAAGDGIIERANFYGGYGRYIRIRHSAEYKTAYAHLSKFAKGIKKNIKVKQGKIIGYVGSSGRSTGPHLHYEVLFNQKQINPNTLKMPEIEILTEKELVDFNSQRATIKQILDNINN